MTNTDNFDEYRSHLPHIPDVLTHSPAAEAERATEAMRLWRILSQGNQSLRDAISSEARRLEPEDLEQRAKVIGSILYILSMIDKSSEVGDLEKQLELAGHVDAIHTVPEAS